MSDLNRIPLEDGFQTSLSESWDGAVGTVNVNATPNFTFPAGVTTYIVANPTNSNIQIAEINAYDAGLKTLTVSNITLEKGAGVNSTQQTHAVNSKIIISDNYQFWADIRTAINSKIDANDGLGVIYADPAARDAALPSPSNGMQVYITSLGLFTDFISGAWSNRATGSVANSSPTVAGKVETGTSAESKAGDDVGGTGANNFVLPSDIAANDQSDTFKYAADAGASDTYVISLTPSLTTYTTGQKIRFKANTVNTGACTINIDGLGATSIKDRAGNDPVDGLIGAGDTLDLYYDGTNFVIDSAPKLSTDAQATTGTAEDSYINPKQAKDNYGKLDNQGTTTRLAATGSGTEVIAHGQSRTPTRVNLYFCENGSNSTLAGGFTGVSDGTNNFCTGHFSGDTINMSTTTCLQMHSGVNGYTATVTIDATNINIVWVQVGTGLDVDVVWTVDA